MAELQLLPFDLKYNTHINTRRSRCILTIPSANLKKCLAKSVAPPELNVIVKELLSLSSDIYSAMI